MFNGIVGSRFAPVGRLVIVLLVLCLGALVLAVPSVSPARAASSPCEAFVTDTIASGQRSIPVLARLNMEIGDSVSGSFPAESNLSVLEAKVGNVPRTVALVIGAASALPGDWKLTLKGKAAICTGTVTVIGAKPKEAR